MLLKRFRSRYPQGSLVSELVQFEQGKYVVCVTVHCDRMVLGTGLGAADTVEEAEDRARTRALALLNLEEDPVLIEAQPINGAKKHRTENLPPTTLPVVEEEAIVRKEESEKISTPPISPPPPQHPQPIPEPPPPSPIKTIEETVPEVIDLPAPPPEPDLDFPPSESFASEPPSPPISSVLEEPPQADITETPSLVPQLTPPSEPLDFDEILSQTNLEIRRLQWTQEQGRKFLLERYGKRSRQFLTDEEFLDFLTYLKSQ